MGDVGVLCFFGDIDTDVVCVREARSFHRRGHLLFVNERGAKGDEVLRSVPEEGAGPRPPLLLAQYLHRQADVFSVLLFSSQRDSDICASVLYIYHAYDRVA